MDTPKLTNVRLDTHYEHELRNEIKFKFPENIKLLKVEITTSDYIETFSNLEYLFLDHMYHVDNRFLLELPKLKEFHFVGDANLHESLVEQKIMFARDDFRIFISGYEFDVLPESEFQRIGHYGWDLNTIQFFQKYQANLRSPVLHFVRSLCYNDFEYAFDNQIPVDLIKKFVDLKEFKIKGGFKYPDQLMNWLSSIGHCLDNLIIESFSIEQHTFNLFDKLPELCPALNSLNIKFSRQLDFNFLLKFRNPYSIEVNQEVPIEIVRNAFKKYRHLGLFLFNYKMLNIRLDRMNGGKITPIILNNNVTNIMAVYKQNKSKIMKLLRSELNLGK